MRHAPKKALEEKLKEAFNRSLYMPEIMYFVLDKPYKEPMCVQSDWAVKNLLSQDYTLIANFLNGVPYYYVNIYRTHQPARLQDKIEEARLRSIRHPEATMCVYQKRRSKIMVYSEDSRHAKRLRSIGYQATHKFKAGEQIDFVDAPYGEYLKYDKD